MKTQDTTLLERLEAWSPDDADSEFTFSQRLARENGWTREFTDRIVREYKRFLFLAVAAGHPVTPSDQVDQAWRLHLLYTRSYWLDLCPNILGVALHHGPTQGGEAEREKFDLWYQRTLSSYCKFFKKSPPADIWPRPSAHPAEEMAFARVNLSQKWLLPKPGWWRCLQIRYRTITNFWKEHLQWPATLGTPAWSITLAALTGLLGSGCSAESGRARSKPISLGG
jgi:hypothetical protein